MYSPTLNQEIARHRQADLLREAKRERLAASVTRPVDHSHRLDFLKSLSTGLRLRLHVRPARPAIDATA